MEMGDVLKSLVEFICMIDSLYQRLKHVLSFL